MVAVYRSPHFWRPDWRRGIPLLSAKVSAATFLIRIPSEQHQLSKHPTNDGEVCLILRRRCVSLDHPDRRAYLKSLSKAERASFTSAAAVVVSRSMVLRASKRVHSLRNSFLGIRSVIGLRH